MSAPNRPASIEHLIQKTSHAIDRGELDSASAYIHELSSIVHGANRHEDHPALLLSIADLAQRLGDARAELKMTAAATADYLLALRELGEFGAGPDEVNLRMAQAADALCRLFRYRLPVRTLLSGMREALADSDNVSERQAQRIGANLLAGLPADPDQEICYWHHWVPECIEVFEKAASVYANLTEHDAPRYRPEAARIRMELARQMQTSKNAAERLKAAETARLAAADYLILRGDDNEKYRPLMAEALHLASNMHWKLRQHDRLQADAPVALELYRQMGAPGDADTLERIALLAEILALSYQKTNQAPRAVPVLEELLPFCRTVAGADPINAEPILADALHSLGLACLFTNEEKKAEQALSEAVRLSRKLAAQDGQAHAEMLVTILDLYANLHSQEGRWEQAIDLQTEAERWKNKKFRVS